MCIRDSNWTNQFFPSYRKYKPGTYRHEITQNKYSGVLIFSHVSIPCTRYTIQSGIKYTPEYTTNLDMWCIVWRRTTLSVHTKEAKYGKPNKDSARSPRRVQFTWRLDLVLRYLYRFPLGDGNLAWHYPKVPDPRCACAKWRGGVDDARHYHQRRTTLMKQKPCQWPSKGHMTKEKEHQLVRT